MGLYDSIFLKVRCPYCKEISQMEFQTKDGDYCMNNYKVGDIFQSGKFRKIDATGSCESPICQFEVAKEAVWTMGYYGGFSRSFDVIIYCDNKGRITNKLIIKKLWNHKGIMKGRLGELKGEEDNMKIVKFMEWDKKRKKFTKPKLVPMTTGGWLDKFKEDSFDGGKVSYKNILYLYNLEDCEEAMKYWFIFRYNLDRIIGMFIKEFKIKTDEEMASIFLSNDQFDILDLYKEEIKNEIK